MQISSLTRQRFDTNVSASHNKNEAPNYLLANKRWSSVLSLAYRPRVENMKGGSVVECLFRDRRAAGSSLSGVTALWSLSKTHLS